MDTEIRDNPDQRRYELFADGALAGFAAYRVRDGLTVITHSEVDNAYRGKGLGSVLARQTLDLLREQRRPGRARVPVLRQVRRRAPGVRRPDRGLTAQAASGCGDGAGTLVPARISAAA